MNNLSVACDEWVCLEFEVTPDFTVSVQPPPRSPTSRFLVYGWAEFDTTNWDLDEREFLETFGWLTSSWLSGRVGELPLVLVAPVLSPFHGEIPRLRHMDGQSLEVTTGWLAPPAIFIPLRDISLPLTPGRIWLGLRAERPEFPVGVPLLATPITYDRPTPLSRVADLHALLEPGDATLIDFAKETATADLRRLLTDPSRVAVMLHDPETLVPVGTITDQGLIGWNDNRPARLFHALGEIEHPELLIQRSGKPCRIEIHRAEDWMFGGPPEELGSMQTEVHDFDALVREVRRRHPHQHISLHRDDDNWESELPFVIYGGASAGTHHPDRLGRAERDLQSVPEPAHIY